MNALTYNVGFHNEHHDFPQIPHTRLHKVTLVTVNLWSRLESKSLACFVTSRQARITPLLQNLPPDCNMRLATLLLGRGLTG